MGNAAPNATLHVVGPPGTASCYVLAIIAGNRNVGRQRVNKAPDFGIIALVRTPRTARVGRAMETSARCVAARTDACALVLKNVLGGNVKVRQDVRRTHHAAGETRTATVQIARVSAQREGHAARTARALVSPKGRRYVARTLSQIAPETAKTKGVHVQRVTHAVAATAQAIREVPAYVRALTTEGMNPAR